MTRIIFDNCDGCAPNLKAASLSDHHRHLIVKLHWDLEYVTHEELLSITIPPQQACDESCPLRTAYFSNGDIPSGKRSNRNVNGSSKMQTNPHDPKEGEVQDETPHNNQERHEYNCECHECQIKFGSLPLLASVIEGQEKSSLENIPANPSTTLQDPQVSSLNEPSTSSSSSSSLTVTKKTMTCPFCDKAFTHRGDLNKHLRKHTGEQPYSCRLCKRKFAHTSNLNRHLRVHSGDKPFVCDICNKNFSRKDKLELHKKTKLCRKSSQRKN